MKKVKDYLDKYYFKIISKIDTKQPFNGWEYPKGIRESEILRFKKNNSSNWIPKNQIAVSINNETLLINMITIDGKNESIYSYLQTYEHIPRHSRLLCKKYR